MNKIEPKLQHQIELILKSMGYELVGCEWIGSLLRIYIDKQGGISVDDCTRVSRQLSATFDVADPFKGHYTLEVSSPGIERPLFLLEHFQRFVGSQVKIKLNKPINKCRQFKGTIVRVEDDNVCILLEGAALETVLPFSWIERANLMVDVSI